MCHNHYCNMADMMSMRMIFKNEFKDIWVRLWSSSYRGNKDTRLCFHKCLRGHSNHTSRNIFCSTLDTDLGFLPSNISRCIFRCMVLIYVLFQM